MSSPEQSLARRPIKARSSAWAIALSGRLARAGVTANSISLLSILAAGLGGALIALYERPIGWLLTDHLRGEGVITAELADPSSPTMDRRTTLKDALSMLLDQDVQSGIVIDRTGQLRGLLTIRAVMDWMRDERSRSVVVEADPAGADPAAVDPTGTDDGA